jgi:hypothetical protein
LNLLLQAGCHFMDKPTLSNVGDSPEKLFRDSGRASRLNRNLRHSADLDARTLETDGRCEPMEPAAEHKHPAHPGPLYLGALLGAILGAGIYRLVAAAPVTTLDWLGLVVAATLGGLAGGFIGRKAGARRRHHHKHHEHPEHKAPTEGPN